jgi:hypothetical protein
MSISILWSKSLIITWSTTDRRSHIQTWCGSSVRHCGMLSDPGHGYRLAHHFLKLAKTGLILHHHLSLWRQHYIHLCLVSCPLSLECSVENFLRDRGMPRALWSCLWGFIVWVYGPPHRQNIRPNLPNPASILGLIVVRLGICVVWCPAYRPLCHARQCGRVSRY